MRRKGFLYKKRYKSEYQIRDRQIKKRKIVNIIKTTGLNKLFVYGSITIGTAIIIVQAIWTFISIFDYFNGDVLLVGVGGVIVPVSLSVFFLYLKIKLSKLTKEEEISHTELMQSEQFCRRIIDETIDIIDKEILFKDIQEKEKRGENKKVIELATVGAKLMLRLAKYDFRLEYGIKMRDAAIKLEDTYSESVAYIDCIGWSYFKMHKNDCAKEEINKGIKLLYGKSGADIYLMQCKANRHLAGIELSEKDIKNAKLHIQYLEENVSQLKGTEKIVMCGYIAILKGDCFVLEGNNEKAKTEYLDALYWFHDKAHNFEREIKVYYKLGKVESIMNQQKFALTNFIKGYVYATRISRIDEAEKNCTSICDELNNIKDINKKQIILEELYNSKEFNDFTMQEKTMDIYYFNNTKSELQKRVGKIESHENEK